MRLEELFPRLFQWRDKPEQMPEDLIRRLRDLQPGHGVQFNLHGRTFVVLEADDAEHIASLSRLTIKEQV